MIGLNDKTTGQIVRDDGSIATMPATLMSAESAHALRSYFHWALSNSLEPELYCGACFNGSRDDKAIYNVTDAEIQIICRCQSRVFFGETSARAAVAPSITIAGNDTGAATVLLSADAARLLRLYDKHVLKLLNLKEALRCNACYELDNADGCHAQVLTQSVLIECRCSKRTHQGMTL